MLAQAPIKKRTRPDWLKIKLTTSGKFLETQKLIRENNLHTVCEEARGPNIYECWEATFGRHIGANPYGTYGESYESASCGHYLC